MPILTTNPTDLTLLKEYSYHSTLDAFELIQKFSLEQIQWKNISVEARAQKVKKVAAQLLLQKAQLAKQATLEMVRAQGGIVGWTAIAEEVLKGLEQWQPAKALV